MTTLWSGRFDTTPDAATFEFGRSFRFDRRLFEDDVTGSLAWARALVKAGVITGDDGRRIEQALSDILAAPTRGVSTAPTRTFTASWSAFSSNGSEMPDVVFIPADPGTNKFHSICACICGVGSLRCSGESRTVSARSSGRPQLRTTRSCQLSLICGRRSRFSLRTSFSPTWRLCGATTIA